MLARECAEEIGPTLKLFIIDLACEDQEEIPTQPTLKFIWEQLKRAKSVMRREEAKKTLKDWKVNSQEFASTTEDTVTLEITDEGSTCEEA